MTLGILSSNQNLKGSQSSRLDIFNDEFRGFKLFYIILHGLNADSSYVCIL